MLSDGFVCVGAGGAVTGNLSSSLSLLLSLQVPAIRPSILGTTADFYKFPNVGFNRGTSSEDLESVSHRGESVSFGCARRAQVGYEALLTPAQAFSGC